MAFNPESYIRTISAPLSVQIEMTDSCNEKCKHCYNSWQLIDIIKKRLSKDKIDRIVSELKNNNVFHVTITWGEPLLEKNLTFYAISKLLDVGISATMNSNLTLMDATTAKELEKIWLKYILSSLISANPNTHNIVTQTKNGFEKWLNGVKNIQENTNIALGVNMVLTQFNKDDVYDTGKFLSQLGVQNFFVTRWSFPAEMHNFWKIAVSWEETLRWLDELLRVQQDFALKTIDILECYPLCLLAEDSKYSIFSNHKCSAGVTTATIWTDWGVRPCSHSNKSYWNIFDEDLKTIWWRMEDWRCWEYLPDKCKNCEALEDCSWGCRLDAEWANGSINSMDPFAREKNVPRIVNLKKPNTVDLSSLLEENLKIVNNIILRQEKEWYIVGKWLNQLFVTQDSWELLALLKKREYFDIKTISKEFDISEEVLDNFLFILYKKWIISIVN